MDKFTFYTTIENQVRQDDSKGLLYDHYTNYEQALAKYFTICAAASVSGIPYHSAHLLQDDGRMIMQQIFDRRPTIEPEPEPEPEPTPEPEEDEPSGSDEESDEEEPIVEVDGEPTE